MIDLTLGEQCRMLQKLLTMRPIAEYNQDEDGPALFWNLPVQEPPVLCMEPVEEFGEGAFTHWSPLPNANNMTASDGTEVHN
jgi:hypothetical protein